MSQNSDYKNLKELTKSLSNGINKLESGELKLKELTSLLEDARLLHERIAVLQYLTIEKDVKGKEVKKAKKEVKKAQGSFELNFGTPESVADEVNDKEVIDDVIHPNQTNLLDAIEEHVVDVVEEVFEKNEDTEDITKEISESDANLSINEKFAEESSNKTLADKLGRQPIDNLKTAIGINQKFLFMNDLFNGENADFNEAIQKLNEASSIEDAMNYIKTELETKYNWDNEHKSVISFIDIVERRFMA